MGKKEDKGSFDRAMVQALKRYVTGRSDVEEKRSTSLSLELCLSETKLLSPPVSAKIHQTENFKIL